MHHLIPLALLSACAVPPASSPEPGLDLNLTEGHTAEEHVEVAPGVYMLEEVVDAGEITYHPHPLPPVSDPESQLPWEAPDPEDVRNMISPMYSYCYEYDSDFYSDQTSGGSLFGGDPYWYASATTYSYDYESWGYDYHYDQASTYVYTSAPRDVDYVYAYSYVYVNGSYVGYASQYVSGGRIAYAYGTWTAPCSPEGYLALEASTYHYMTVYGEQSISVTDTLRSRVMCCPD